MPERVSFNLLSGRELGADSADAVRKFSPGLEDITGWQQSGVIEHYHKW